jgi:fibronectin type 3 domain-containing protein
MRRISKAALLAAGLAVSLLTLGASKAHAETLTATFTQPDGGITVGSYSGLVRIQVAGVGQAYGATHNDAFYLYDAPFGTPKNGHDGSYYQLTMGANRPLFAFDQSCNAARFLVGPLPAYNPEHEYSFVLDTGLTTPGSLHFGVSDGGFSDNTGAYTITVTQLSADGEPIGANPEPVSPAAPGVAQVVVDPNSVEGGKTTAGEVALTRPAGPGGDVVTLDSSDPAAAVAPATVQVPEGSATARFPVTSFPVSDQKSVTIGASFSGSTVKALLHVLPVQPPLPAVNGIAAPPVYNPANGHWYQEVQGPALTWAQARDAAAALSYAGLPGHLATLNAFNEDQFIVNNVPNAQSGSTHWIGGYQDRLAPDYSEPVGGWRWVTGEPWGYTNWNGGEPNNAGGVEDFLQWLPPGNWNDVPGAATITGFLVEYEPPIPQFAASQVTITPSPVTGGQSATGTVTLSQAAGTSGISVYLGSSHPEVAAVPPTVTVPAGQTTAAFTVTTNPVSVPTPVLISASGPTGSASVSLQVADSGAPLPQVNGALTPPVYNPANGHWYQEVSAALTWAQARAAAAGASYAGYAGHLVTITSAEENQFILTHLPNSTECWIGLYQDRTAPDYSEPAGGWRWITGEPYAWNDWRGEPNNANGNEDWAVMRGTVGWNDLAATNLDYGYIIEYEAPPAPPAAPTTLAAATASVTQINLSWTDNSDSETGFELQRKAVGGDWTKVAVTAANVNTFSDTGLASFTHYTYRIRAVIGASASDWSNEAGGDTGTRGQVSLSASGPINFGTQTVGTASAAQTVTITNSGNAPLTLGSLTMAGNNASEFALVPPLSTPKTLAPGESGSLSLVFTPAGIGLCSAALTIASDAPGGPATLALTGSGAGPMVRLSPTSLEFGPEPVGLNGTLAVLIQNNGNAALHVSSIAFQGANAGDFSLATDGITGHTLQPGDISLLNVRFSPVQTGNRVSTLVISDDAAGSPQSIALTGFGTAPLLRLSADSLIFGLPAGSTTQTLKLTNNGDAPLTIEGLTLSGPDAGSFRIVSDTGEKNVPVGGSRTVQIAFQSATIASRQRSRAARIAAAGFSAMLEIKDNDPHPTSRHTVALIAGSRDTAPATPSTPPVAPSGLSAQVVSPGEIDLTWKDNSSNEQAFALWRKDGSGDWHRIALLAPNGTHFADRGLAPGTRYTYRVRATAGNLASDWSNEGPAATPPLLPAAPSSLTATVISPREVDLAWTKGLGDETGVAIFRQTGSGAWQRIADLKPNATGYADRSAQPGSSYRYRVRTHDSTQVSVWSNEVPAVTPPLAPAAPGGLSAQAVSPGEIDLTWKDNSSNEEAFALWRKDGSGDWHRIALLAPNGTHFADRGLAPGTRYTYRVRATAGNLASDWSNEGPAATPLVLPVTVTNLTARVVAPTEIDLTWKASGSGATGIAIWRQAGSEPWQRIGVVKPSATRYTDRSVQPRTSYTYRVRAHSSTAVSEWTNVVKGVTPTAP